MVFKDIRFLLIQWHSIFQEVGESHGPPRIIVHHVYLAKEGEFESLREVGRRGGRLRY